MLVVDDEYIWHDIWYNESAEQKEKLAKDWIEHGIEQLIKNERTKNLTKKQKRREEKRIIYVECVEKI